MGRLNKFKLPLMMYGTYKKKIYTKQNSKGLFPSENIIHINVFKGGKATGQRALSVMAEAHRDNWRMIALSWKNRSGYRTPNKKKVYVDLVFYLPDRRVRDTHNVPKLLLDALKGIVATDDYFILLRIQDFFIDAKDPRIEIEVIPYEEADRSNE